MSKLKKVTIITNGKISEESLSRLAKQIISLYNNKEIKED